MMPALEDLVPLEVGVGRGGRTSSILCKGIRAGSTVAALSEGEGWCRGAHGEEEGKRSGKVENPGPRGKGGVFLTLYLVPWASS